MSQPEFVTLEATTDITDEYEPVTITEAKSHLRYESGEEDAAIRRAISSARQVVSITTGLILGNSTWAYTAERFPSEDFIDLTTSPVQSITSVEYIDNDGATQTFASSKYDLDTGAKPSLIRLNYNETWPTARSVYNAVIVTFVAGYATSSAVPASLKQAVLYWVSQFFERRDLTTEKALSEVPRTAMYLSNLNRAKGIH